MLPNFFIIGAARSGTTSLYEYLRQHPAIFMSPVKEPSYFAFMESGVPGGLATNEWHRRTSVTSRAEYEALFAAAGSAAAVGEASPIYMVAPGVAARIRDLVPDARLIAVLRHAVERAYAGYLGLRRDGQVPGPTFEEQLRREERLERERPRLLGLVKAGFYHRQLTRYYDLFPAEQIRIYLYEDLVASPIGLLQDLFSFLEVDATQVPDVSRRHARTGIIRNPLLRLFWTRSGGVRRVLRPVLPERARDRAFIRITRDLERPPLAPDTRARLLEVYREEVLALQELIGRDLSRWLE